MPWWKVEILIIPLNSTLKTVYYIPFSSLAMTKAELCPLILQYIAIQHSNFKNLWKINVLFRMSRSSARYIGQYINNKIEGSGIKIYAWKIFLYAGKYMYVLTNCGIYINVCTTFHFLKIHQCTQQPNRISLFTIACGSHFLLTEWR